MEDPLLNLVHGNTSLHLRAFFEAGGSPSAEPMVEVEMLVSVSCINQPGRIVPVPPTVGFTFLLPLSTLFPAQLRQQQVEDMLSDISHPRLSDIDFWTEQIASFAIHAANAVVREGYSGFFLLVDFTISMDPAQIMDEVLRDDEDIGEAEMSVNEEVVELLLSLEQTAGVIEEFGAAPASESSIKALESKTYEGDGKDGSRCTICLEDFEAGIELTIMPCSHEFHQSCVTKWLEQNRTCPLCRYAMPTV